MALYVKVFTSFYSHRKTLRLVAAIGNDAFWVPPRLWSYAAGSQPDGVLQDYSARELALIIGYTGDAQALLQALLQAGFLDSDPLRIHDWDEHNNYHSAFADRAKKAAKARWERDPKEEKIGEDKRGEEPSIASSNASSMLQASQPVKPAQQSDEEWLTDLSKNEAYQGIDVRREFQKMSVWCHANRRVPSRKRFVNWLNRVEKPMSGKVQPVSQHTRNNGVTNDIAKQSQDTVKAVARMQELFRKKEDK